MSIKTTLKAMKKDQKLVICAPKIETEITGISRAFISKGGHVTAIYSDGLAINRKLPNHLLEGETISFRQIHSFLNPVDEDTGLFSGVMTRDLNDDEQDAFDSIFPERDEI